MKQVDDRIVNYSIGIVCVRSSLLVPDNGRSEQEGRSVGAWSVGR
jgi:hypothetical protein